MPEEVFRYKIELDTSGLAGQLQQIQTSIGSSIRTGLGVAQSGAETLGAAGYSAMSDLMRGRSFINVPQLPPPVPMGAYGSSFDAALYPQQRGFFGTAMAAAGVPWGVPRGMYKSEYQTAAQEDLSMRLRQGATAGAVMGGTAAALSAIGGLVGGPIGAIALPLLAADPISQDLLGAISTLPQQEMLRTALPAVTYGNRFSSRDIKRGAAAMRNVGLQTDFTIPEVTGLVAEGVRAGAFEGARDMDEIIQLTKRWVGTVQEVNRALRIEAENSQATARMIGNMVQGGMSMNDVLSEARMAGGVARLYGQDPTRMYGGMQAMGQAAIGMGMTMATGVSGFRQVETGLMGMANAGILGAGMLREMGGMAGGARGITGAAMQFMQTPFFRAGMFAGNQAMVEFGQGNLTPQQMMGLAAQRGASQFPAEQYIDFLYGERAQRQQFGVMGALQTARGLAEAQRQRAIESGLISTDYDPARFRAYTMHQMMPNMTLPQARAAEFLLNDENITRVARAALEAGITMEELQAGEAGRFVNQLRSSFVGEFRGVTNETISTMLRGRLDPYARRMRELRAAEAGPLLSQNYTAGQARGMFQGAVNMAVRMSGIAAEKEYQASAASKWGGYTAGNRPRTLTRGLSELEDKEAETVFTTLGTLFGSQIQQAVDQGDSFSLEQSIAAYLERSPNTETAKVLKQAGSPQRAAQALIGDAFLRERGGEQVSIFADIGRARAAMDLKSDMTGWKKGYADLAKDWRGTYTATTLSARIGQVMKLAIGENLVVDDLAEANRLKSAMSMLGKSAKVTSGKSIYDPSMARQLTKDFEGFSEGDVEKMLGADYSEYLVKQGAVEEKVNQEAKMVDEVEAITNLLNATKTIEKSTQVLYDKVKTL